ncbi:UNVERIFIED_CONTAM: hypothetical protein FKN15_057070 [Acipenser sinensis]
MPASLHPRMPALHRPRMPVAPHRLGLPVVVHRLGLPVAPNCLGLPVAPHRTLAAGDTVTGALEEGAAGYEEGGRSGDHPPSTLSAAKTTPAGGARLETTFPSSTLAAGDTVAGTPEEGAASYEEGGRSGDRPPSSCSAAGIASRRVWSSWPLQLFGWKEDIPPWPPPWTIAAPVSGPEIKPGLWD